MVTSLAFELTLPKNLFNFKATRKEIMHKELEKKGFKKCIYIAEVPHTVRVYVSELHVNA